MPEETKDFIHIPVRKDIVEDTIKTIILSATKGIKALIGRLKEDDGKTYIKTYLFDKSKGWTMKKAKGWIAKKKSEKESFDVGLSKTQIQLLMPMKTTKGAVVNDRIIEGYATMSSFNRNGYHVTNDAFSDTLEEFMENPVLLFMHYSSLVIGSVLELKIDDVGVFVKAQLLSAGKSEVADEAWNAIEEGSLKAFSIGFLVLAFQKVCMEKDLCFFSVTEGELVELSVVSVPAVRGSYFKVLKKTAVNPKNTNFSCGNSNTVGMPFAPRLVVNSDGDLYTSWDNNTMMTTWPTVDTGTWKIVPYEYQESELPNLDDNEEKTKVEKSMTDTPVTPDEDDSGEDLSSTVKQNDELEARLLAVEEAAKAMAEKEVKLAEQTLNLSVKETMTLFKGVDNKTVIEENVATIAKCGGKESLDAMRVILKRVMESMVVVDNSLTPSGGEGMSTEDKQSLEDLGGTVPEMVARIMEEHKRKEGN